MKKLWYKTWFDTEEYSEIYKHRDDSDAEKLIRLILKNIPFRRGSKVLDIPCGNGRHSLLLAGKNFDVTGIDISTVLIKSAKSKSKLLNKKNQFIPEFFAADMRNICFKNEFDVVLNLFSSFGYFERDRDNERVISAISKSLKKKGYFVMDFLNRDYLAEKIVPFDIKKINYKFVVQIRTLDRDFIKKNILIFSGIKYKISVKKFEEKIRLYSFMQLKHMFGKYGLKILKTFGDYSGNKFSKKSERLIIIAQKK